MDVLDRFPGSSSSIPYILNSYKYEMNFVMSLAMFFHILASKEFMFGYVVLISINFSLLLFNQ